MAHRYRDRILAPGVSRDAADLVAYFLGRPYDAAAFRAWLERSPALVAALAPKIGYAESAKLAKEAVQRGLTVKELVVEKGLLEGRELEEVLDLRAMTEIGVPGGKPIPAGG